MTREPLAPLTKESLTDRLARQIRGWIAGNDHAGERLPSIMEMARRFGVGQPSIREALRKLEAMGAVEIRHGSGVYVRPAAAEPPIDDLMSARVPVETQAAADAARHATAADVRELRRLVAVEQDDVIDGSRLRAERDAAFHRQVALASGNTVLVRLFDTLNDLTTPLQRVAFAGSAADQYRDHAAIVDAIEARDEIVAAELMRAHLGRRTVEAPVVAPRQPLGVGVFAAVMLGCTLALNACGGGDATTPDVPTVPVTPVVSATDTMSLRTLAQRGARRIGVGTAVGYLFNSQDAASASYMRVLAREFDVITAEYDMKFDFLQPSRGMFRFARSDSMIAFAQANGMQVRGHTLVWHQALPSWVTNGTWTKAEAKALLDAHITGVVEHFKGRLLAWDVVNEAFNDGSAALRPGFWANTIGREYIEQAFRTARAVDPAVPLFYNDYNIEGAGAKADSVYALLADFKARGVPVDGIGMQMHLVVGQLPAGMAQNFARFASLGLKIHITELDVRVPTPSTNATLQTQAQNYRQVFDLCLQTPACEMVVTWGFTDRSSWVPGTFAGQGDALLFDASFGKKPAYNAVHDLLAGK